jgi:hypothetical protein
MAKGDNQEFTLYVGGKISIRCPMQPQYQKIVVSLFPFFQGLINYPATKPYTSID